MHRFHLILLSALILGACTKDNEDTSTSIVFELNCVPIEKLGHSLKGDAAFSSEQIVLRYGSSVQSFNIRLGNDYVLNQINPIAILRGKPVSEPVIRNSRTRGIERFSFTVERESMGVAQYLYRPSTGLLTEIYLNLEPYDANDLSKGAREAIIASQSFCKPLHTPNPAVQGTLRDKAA